MKARLSITTILIFTIQFCLCQNEFRNWHFGFHAGLDFSTSPPTVLTNGLMNAVEGVAAISDNSGNLLFYTDGINVRNSTHALMANGTGLNGHGSSTQAAVVVKQPGNMNIYYVFTTTPGLYSIVDMSLAAGLGSVTVKNATLHLSTCEKAVAVRHCNGRDAWVITHDYGNNQFRAVLLTSSGLSAPVISAVGENVSVGIAQAGHMKVSPDGRKLAVAFAGVTSTPSIGGGFQLFDFDAATGAISNSLTLLNAAGTPTDEGAYGLEFSPDGTKLYGITSNMFGSASATFNQWNICAGNPAAIIASRYTFTVAHPAGSPGFGSAQSAVDGKIYVTATYVQSLSVINNPNASGAAMNFVLNQLDITPGSARLGLPNFINGYTRTAPSSFANVIACSAVSFSAPTAPTFSSGCSSTPYLYSGYKWDFGEPVSGTANTSTLANVAHSYSTIGTYTVSLILYGNCTNDTIKQVVNIAMLGPTPEVSGTMTICKGATQVYTASGGSTYAWSNNTTASTVALSPQATTVYTLSASLNGCTVSKAFTVTVNPCPGFSDYENDNKLQVFPNPFGEELSIVSPIEGTLVIEDLDGRILLEEKLAAGKNNVNTERLKAGIYIIHTISSTGTSRARIVKL